MCHGKRKRKKKIDSLKFFLLISNNKNVSGALLPTMELKIIISTAFSAIMVFIMGPILIYFTKKFIDNRNELFIKKRYPKITLFLL